MPRICPTRGHRASGGQQDTTPARHFCALPLKFDPTGPAGGRPPRRVPDLWTTADQVSAPSTPVLQCGRSPSSRRGVGKWCRVALASGNSEDPRGARRRRSVGLVSGTRSFHLDDVEGRAATSPAPVVVDQPVRRSADRTARQGPLAHIRCRTRLPAGSGYPAHRGGGIDDAAIGPRVHLLEMRGAHRA